MIIIIITILLWEGDGSGEMCKSGGSQRLGLLFFAAITGLSLSCIATATSCRCCKQQAQTLAETNQWRLVF
ncbi:MAG: hypothetical protein B0D91_12535 [Oceanospirillales bacterium LUC14_002_19_P2]|nr:MAG: hypothetical protein B0D91_12535 [Oceanospirillales bacterium LUC14_002_19_P2]